MKIIKNIKVPTGNILIGDGEKGKIEFLSIGDYGKEKNVKASFMSLDNEIEGVPNGDIMPLEKKWVVTISTQYGCSMGCKFCDVPKVGHGKNATLSDLNNQIIKAIKLHPEITGTDRLNIHFARMGEPTFNEGVLHCAQNIKKVIYPYLGNSLIHPVVSTMMPKQNRNLLRYLKHWCILKNKFYRGNAGLQFSINSTSDSQRNYLFSGRAHMLKDVADMALRLPDPVGRKYALNFALSDSSIINASLLAKLFSPKKFMTKITPLHMTTACSTNDIKTTGGYTSYTPYKKIEEELKDAGFDVLVFIPSIDEDLGRITCGNAILSGTVPETEYEVSEVPK